MRPQHLLSGHGMRMIPVTTTALPEVLAYCVCGEVGPQAFPDAKSLSWQGDIEAWFWDHATSDTFDTKPQMEVPFP